MIATPVALQITKRSKIQLKSMTSKKRTADIRIGRTTTRGERTIKHENNPDSDEDKYNEEPICQNMLAPKGSLG